MAVKTVLLVDDSKSARLVLRKMLEKNSLNVDLAESAEDAFTYLLGHQPDAIFMDHLMPGMDGLEATEVILKNPATQSIPIVMCTSKDGSDFTREARLRGVMDILPKPPSASAVTKVLESISEYNEQCKAQAAGVAEKVASEATAKPVVDNGIQKQDVEAIVETVAGRVAQQLFDARMNDGEVMQRWVGPVLEVALTKLQDEVLLVAKASARNIAEEVASQDSQELKQSIQVLYDLVEKQNEASAQPQSAQSESEQTALNIDNVLEVVQEQLEIFSANQAVADNVVVESAIDEAAIDEKLVNLEKRFPEFLEQEISSVASSLKETTVQKISQFEGSIVQQVNESVETFKKEFSTELDLLAQQNDENKNKITNLQLVDTSADSGVDETLNLRLQSLESEVLNKAKSHTQSVADNVFQLIEDIQPSINQNSLDALKGEMVQLIHLKEAELSKKVKLSAIIGGAVGVVAAAGAIIVSQFLF
ncbi:MAG: hypothetical protein COB04_15585 [Gammaproteobacteria bacterium]|nr:MAG: hypothetical protein COB04_15585 [Gammaproteobacteria bacterium]